MDKTIHISLWLAASVSLSFAYPAAAISLTNFPPGDANVDALPQGREDMARVWLSGPNVRCNDGSTPAMYVSEGNGFDRDKWIIYLQGGGSCGNEAACLDRWQSRGSQPNYGIQKMSTSVPQVIWDAVHTSAPNGWTLQGVNYQIPETIKGTGIFAPTAGNNFRDWTKVFVYYCSSDDWTGQNNNHLFATAPMPYRVAFNGARIFDAAIETLRSGTVSYVIGDIGHQMPNLDNSEFTLMAGSSGGANGLKHNLDRVREYLNQYHMHDVESVVRGLFDAGGSPYTAALPWPLPPAPVNSYEQYFETLWNDVYLGVWNARVDDSCLNLNPVGLQYRCADSTHVLQHHITTPFFHRMDLQDPQSSDSYRKVFYPDPPYAPIPPYTSGVALSRFANDVVAQLTDLGDFASVLAPQYPDELDTITNDRQWLNPGIYGPRCVKHVGLLGTATFFTQSVDDGGTARTYHDSLWEWVNLPPTGILGPQGPIYIEPVGVGPAPAPQC